MKKLSLLILLVLLGHGALGQRYNTSVGIKGDWSNINADLAEFSVKHFFAPQSAFEINFGAGRRYIWTEGLYLFNSPLKNRFDWYVGGGLDFGYWNTNYDGRYDSATRSGFWGGSTGVFGIEYTFDVIPINVALDMGPTIRMIPDFEIGVKVGFATRYAFGAR